MAWAFPPNWETSAAHGYGQGDALIQFWLHTVPEEDLALWAEQVRRAVWMERRYFEAMSRSLWGVRKG